MRKSLAYWEAEGALEERKARIWATPEPTYNPIVQDGISKLLEKAKGYGLDINRAMKLARKIMHMEYGEGRSGEKTATLRLAHVCEALQYVDSHSLHAHEGDSV